MIRHKTFKFRLKTSSKVEAVLAQFAGANRFVWNKALALQKERLDKKEYALRYYDLASKLKEWKSDSETAFLRDCPSQSLQQTLMCLDKALMAAFSKTDVKRFPQFKKKFRGDSYRYPQGIKLDKSKIFLPKIGWVGFFKSRKIVGTIKNATVTQSGKYWFVSIQTEQSVPDPVHPSKKIVAIDMGIKHFAYASDGNQIAPKSSFKKHQDKLKKEQKILSRRKRGSNNFKKQKLVISKLHTKIKNVRLDFLHKVSTRVSKNHAMVVLEDLRVRNMSKSAKGTKEKPGKNVKAKSGLNRSILDQGWHAFKTFLDYKLKWTGGELILVDPKYTSQKCSRCGHRDKRNRQSQSKFLCGACGYSKNADLNAARNILAAGHAVLACGDTRLVAA